MSPLVEPIASDITAIPEIAVIVPCYNEEDNVCQIHSAIRAELQGHASSWEIIFIDNASTDETRNLLRQICAADLNTRAIFNTRNFGQMRSPTYAIYQAEGAAVIAMGADFQDPPSLIPKLIAQWRAGAQVVMGQRKSERASLPTRLSRWVGYQLLGRWADYPVIPGATGFGLYDRAVVDALAAWHEPEPFFRGMVVESGYRVALIPFDRPERERGTTKNDFKTLLDFALSSIAGSAKSLLRIPMILSVYVGIAAVLLLLAVPLAAYATDGVAWPTLLVGIITAFQAILMLFVGMLGEQVRVISERTRNVPLVLEQERLNFPNARQQPALRTAVN